MKIQQTILLILGLMLFSSCNKDNDTSELSNTPVQFSATITKASGTTWGATDQIGVFMKSAGIALDENSLASNVKYINSASGFSATTPIYYPQSGAVDFVAYYPYRETPASEPYKYKVDVSDQTNPAAIDFMYSNNAGGMNKSTTAVALIFDHKLSRIVLNIKGVGDLAGVTAKIKGMPTKWDYYLDGQVGSVSAVADITPITVSPATSGYAATLSAILIPQPAYNWSDRSVVFTVGGKEYTYAIPDEDNFDLGKNYPYEIVVDRTGITVTRGDISPWVTTTPEAVAPIQMPAMVKITAGTFLMGSPDGTGGINGSVAEPSRQSNETLHSVTLTKDFYMSKYQITNAQYAAFLNANSIGSDGKWEAGTYPTEALIYESSGGYDLGLHYNTNKWEPVSSKDKFPVINVTWYGATEYAKWIGGSLPTEAQWEYACRAGTTTPYSFGANNIDGYAWYSDNSSSATHEVGKKSPNAWGLYDMHGNVWEWCSDWYSGYTVDAATDPKGLDTGSYRVLRGGSWFFSAQYCRSASRSYFYPVNAYNTFGFRVALIQ